jgi:hypothetical protein
VHFNIVYGVSRSAYNEVVAQNLARLVYGHIILANVNAVGSNLLYKFNVVVNDEGCANLSASRHNLQGSGSHLINRCVLHAKLNPTAAAFESQQSRFDVIRRVVEMCYKL